MSHSEDSLEVSIVKMWDGKDTQTNVFADLRLRFPQIDLPESFADTSFRDLKLLEEVESELQPLADERFGRNRVRVQGQDVRAGSVDILVSLSAVGTTAWLFFKDYGDVRSGVIAFCDDIKKISSTLAHIVRKHLHPKRKDDSSGGKNSPHERHRRK